MNFLCVLTIATQAAALQVGERDSRALRDLVIRCESVKEPSFSPIATWPPRFGKPRAVAFSPDGRFVASGSGDGKVFFWDWKSGRIFKSLKAHEKVVIGVQWHPLEQSKVATCSWDGAIKYWD